jgi:hypothetical protein
MESTLHRQLKALYSPDAARCEVRRDGFRADALAADGSWIEVQTGALGALREKLRYLLPARRVRVVKPVILERRIIRRAHPEGADLSARRSPRRGTLAEVFDDLVGLARLFPHANLRIDVLGVAIDELRVARRRRPGHTVIDRSLREVRMTKRLATAADLWRLLPPGAGRSGPFTTRELAAWLDRELPFAQRVAYCLRLAGAARVCGKRGNFLVYERATDRAPAVTR